MNAIGLLVLLLMQAASPGGIADAPESSGAYVQQHNASWIKLEPAPIVASKTKGLDAYVYTDGYTNLNVQVVYRGAKAPMRLAVPKPLFFIRQIGSARDIVVIRLSSRKDTRTFQATPSEGTSDNKLGFRKSVIVKMVIVENSGHSFSATPAEPLKPGEYLMIFDTINSGYDFGVD
jgi:hypothetical protein